MGRPGTKAAKSTKAARRITLDDPAAWERFERALDVVVKAKPMHRVAAKDKSKKTKRR